MTEAIIDLFARSHAVDLSKYDDSFLGATIQKRIAATQCGSIEAYAALLGSNSAEAEQFLESLQIYFSEFFRNSLTYAVMERIVLPSLVWGKKRRGPHEIRIWSAACAMGQEPYSLAMLLEEMKNGGESFHYRIFATDQSRSRVDEAGKGFYDAPALQNLTLRRANRWFDTFGESYAVKAELKKNIEFAPFDLFNEHLSAPPESIFGDFDLIVCANVLFYYKHAYRTLILDKIRGSLAAGGYLMTGEAEREILTGHGFKEIIPQSAIFRM